MEHKILIAGFGGQGVMLMGQLLSYAAFLEGREVVLLPAYGGEQRGGTANCSILVSDEAIGSPSVRTYDTVVVMNGPSYVKYGGTVRPEGTLITNGTLVALPDGAPLPARVFEVPTLEIARSLSSERLANIVILGALTAACGSVGKSYVQDVVKNTFGKKGAEMVEMNLKALEAGYAFVTDRG